MAIFLYEHLTGGGLFPDRPSGSLFGEGAAMLGALAADFGQLDGCEVLALRDGRCPDVRLPGCRVLEVGSRAEAEVGFDRLAAEADWTVVIAPELDGVLLDRCRRAHARGRLLSPGPELVELASDKHRTALRLAEAGVPVPAGRLLEADRPLPADFPYPAVLKRCDGAGSVGVERVEGPATAYRQRPGVALRLERFHAGTAASVALVCGPGLHVALPACRQRLSDDGHFRYLGGEAPLAEPLQSRARRLALSALRALPDAVGYVGVDLVLGPHPAGREDVVIEINPRLTSSYGGLRSLARSNLAQAMLQAAQGQRPELCFHGQVVQWDGFEGVVRHEKVQQKITTAD